MKEQCDQFHSVFQDIRHALGQEKLFSDAGDGGQGALLSSTLDDLESVLADYMIKNRSTLTEQQKIWIN